MFAGVKMKIGDEEYIVPAISLGQLRAGVTAQLQEHDALVAAGKTWAAVDIRGQIIYAALRRNYPDLDEAKLLDFLDLSNNGPIWLQVLGVSGFEPGENQAATATETGISNPSTKA